MKITYAILVFCGFSMLSAQEIVHENKSLSGLEKMLEAEKKYEVKLQNRIRNFLHTEATQQERNLVFFGEADSCIQWRKVAANTGILEAENALINSNASDNCKEHAFAKLATIRKFIYQDSLLHSTMPLGIGSPRSWHNMFAKTVTNSAPDIIAYLKACQEELSNPEANKSVEEVVKYFLQNSTEKTVF